MIKVILVICSVILLNGCVNREVPKQKSNFLKNYSNFKPIPHAEVAWFSRTQHFDYQKFKAYDKIAFAPVELWLSKNEPYQIKDLKKQESITHYFENAVKARLKENKQIVRPGTRDSLLIKLAITYLGERSPELDPLDILPFRIVLNSGEMAYLAATGKKVVIGEATVEAEFIDTNTNLGLV